MLRHFAAQPDHHPAAFFGDWCGYRAIIVPQVRPASGLDDGPIWLGALPFPDAEPSVSRVDYAADAALAQDHQGRWWQLGDAVDLPDILEPPAASWQAEWTTPDRAHHRDAVTECLSAIADGEIYQACICTRFTASFTGSPVDFFCDGVAAMQPAKAAYLHGEWGSITSFSPELFLRRNGTQVHSSPIKGTLPHGDDPALLRNSVKDVAENIMIVDLVRNDLGRVAIPGSVRPTALLEIQSAPGVWHMVSTVAATLPESVSDAELIDAAFPPGSVTGTPKLRARELITEWEQFNREYYCGAIGIRLPDAHGEHGGLDLNVAIRTVSITDGHARLGVGGGITIDSTPDAEWNECLAKARSIVTLDHRPAA